MPIHKLTPAALLSAALLVDLTGCSSILGIEDRELNPALADGDGNGGAEPTSTADPLPPGSSAGGNGAGGGSSSAGATAMPPPAPPATVDPPMPPAGECANDADCPADSWCFDRRCELADCPFESADCNADPSDGCETDVMYDPGNCGACGFRCDGPCEGGECMGAPCAAPTTWCMGECVDLSSDPNHCGDCYTQCADGCIDYACTACPNGFEPCGAGCVDTENDPWNCGGCGIACRPSDTCSAGTCMSSCGASQADCGGACVTLNTPDHCGMCNNVCPAPPQNGTVYCDGISCVTACDLGFQNCNGACIDTSSSQQNCGACGYPCSIFETCSGGICALSGCSAGFGDCDGLPINGCEESLNTTSHCGSCGNACAPPNASASCSGGTCQLAFCTTGYDDCDADPSNGCETDLNGSLNCGACGNACQPVTGGTSTCANQSCQITCNTGYGDCAAGCTPLNTATDCGACGVSCTVSNGSGDCASGSCEVGGCIAGWADCNGLAADGCEQRLDTASHCGACNAACSAPNAQTSCSTGTCRILACTPGLADANGVLADGCEEPCTVTGPEVCDYIDNDCDGVVDTAPTPCDVPGLPGLAYGGQSACRQGLQGCDAVCQYYVGPSAEFCDGVDNDCNGVTDDQTADTGDLCGTNVGECQPGTTQCSGGVIVCVGGVDPGSEICNGLDDDCDGSTDEGIALGGPCGSDVGECVSGVMACVGGNVVCQGNVGPQPEICGNLLDENCNGIPDDC